jgi:general secretion pathway protein G
MNRNILMAFAVGGLIGAAAFAAGTWLGPRVVQANESPQEQAFRREATEFLGRVNRFMAEAEPDLTTSSNDARESALSSDLQTVRSQLELYKVQHLDHYPDEVNAGGGWDMDTANFVARLTGTTDMHGNITGNDFGPYLLKFPENSFNKSSAVRFGDGSDLGTGSEGWYFNTKTGKFSPNDPAHIYQ